jgi:hypothetical protein
LIPEGSISPVLFSAEMGFLKNENKVESILNTLSKKGRG